MTARTRTILKWSLMTLLFVYCISMSIWAKGEANRHVCEGIDIVVEGSRQMDTIVVRGVARELALYPHRLKGARLNEINTMALEKYLADLNAFERVSCMISSGGRLKIEIVPLVPVMRVFSGDKSWYINKAGKQIDTKAEFYTDAPIVTGNFNSKFTPEDVLPLVNFIQKDGGMRELTAMIHAADANNLLIVPRMLGHVVNFGDTTRLKEKKKALELFYKKVMPYKGWEEYDTISVKFRGQVVATRRLKPVVKTLTEYSDDDDPDESTLTDNIHPTEEDVARTEE
ncbi:MAG: hypothetical protein HDS62_08980 [Bacteroidales bacterium]|nr:hypothetical protein [Bacteroidales bacterium]MDE6237304.1 hypothetical protein [Muribaculaceae bacterium]MDE6836683.1 hypothetical protein [Muribaculaceae bacterium]